MPHLFKLAFATDDVRQVNQPFTSAKTFAVYHVNPDRAELVKAADFSDLAEEEHDTRLQAMIELLDGCGAAVYCEAIGASATERLMESGIQPIRVSRGAHIAELIHGFQDSLKSGVHEGPHRA